jgi:CRISPR/Cas system CSM-associated protein Csm4 (group 5 of RAMP superfamily)
VQYFIYFEKLQSDYEEGYSQNRKKEWTKLDYIEMKVFHSWRKAQEKAKRRN